jgi:hypothetical protein
MKLIDGQLDKKYPAFYGTQRFITVFKRATIGHYPEPVESSSCPHTVS